MRETWYNGESFMNWCWLSLAFSMLLPCEEGWVMTDMETIAAALSHLEEVLGEGEGQKKGGGG